MSIKMAEITKKMFWKILGMEIHLILSFRLKTYITMESEGSQKKIEIVDN